MFTFTSPSWTRFAARACRACLWLWRRLVWAVFQRPGVSPGNLGIGASDADAIGIGGFPRLWESGGKQSRFQTARLTVTLFLWVKLSSMPSSENSRPMPLCL